MIVSRFLYVSLSLFSSLSFYFLLSLWGPIYVFAAITASFCLCVPLCLFLSPASFPIPPCLRQGGAVLCGYLSPPLHHLEAWIPLPPLRSVRGAIPLGAIPLLATRWQKRASLRVARPGGSPARTVIGTELCQSQRLPERGGAPEPLPGQWGKPRLQRTRSHWTVTEKRQALWSCFILQLSSPKLAGRGHRLSTVLCMRKVFSNHYLTHCHWKQKTSLILHSDVWLSVDALRFSFPREERDASVHS